MMFWYGGHIVLWEAALMWVAMIAFWGLIVWAIYAFVSSSGRPVNDVRDNEARRTLDQRLARGDIDVDEYRRLLDVIVDGGSTPVATGDRR